MLPTWVKVTKSRFNEIKNIITENRKNKLKATIIVKEVTLDNIE